VKYVLVILLLTFSFQVRAGEETGLMSVYVYEIDSINPIIGASIEIEGNTQLFSSDLDGIAVLPDLEPGTYSVIVRAVGYENETKDSIEIRAGGRSEVAFLLYPEYQSVLARPIYGSKQLFDPPICSVQSLNPLPRHPHPEIILRALGLWMETIPPDSARIPDDIFAQSLDD
jgi:Carboxypeptidase regulatory-like domain